MQILGRIDSRIAHMDERLDTFVTSITRLEENQREQGRRVSDLETDMGSVKGHVHTQRFIIKAALWILGFLIPALLSFWAFHVREMKQVPPKEGKETIAGIDHVQFRAD